jgi:hypothetical protein
MARYLNTLSFLTIAVLLVAAGCDKKGDDGKAAKTGSTPASSAPAPTGGAMTGKPIEACSLLTKADAEAATGEKLGDPEGKKSACTFIDKDGVKVVLLEVDSLNDPSTAKQMFDIGRSNDAEPASGIGDAAVWGELMGAQRLRVLKGSYVVTLQIYVAREGGNVKEPSRKAALALIPKVLGKLP